MCNWCVCVCVRPAPIWELSKRAGCSIADGTLGVRGPPARASAPQSFGFAGRRSAATRSRRWRATERRRSRASPRPRGEGRAELGSHMGARARNTCERERACQCTL